MLDFFYAKCYNVKNLDICKYLRKQWELLFHNLLPREVVIIFYSCCKANFSSRVTITPNLFRIEVSGCDSFFWESIFMNEISILHLSDLHIDCKEGYSRLLGKLIDDIKDQVTYIANKTLVVVVTGDILHQGPKKSKNQVAYNNALCFFKDLYAIIKDKVVAIYIVPGNHDKYRGDFDRFVIPAYRASNNNFIGAPKARPKFDDSFYNNFWDMHLSSYMEDNGTGYLQLVKEINKIFGLSDEEINKKLYFTNTFGVDVIEVLGKRYCFVLLNTAWSCIDDNDNRNIIIGEFQINQIKKEFSSLVSRNIKNKNVELTIVLGHHPLGSLLGEEEDRIFSEMVSFEGLEANVYLCGHTHDRTVNNWVNNRHSINTFVTGIGWPEDERATHVGDHTYSMYIFNTNANSIDVYVRSTKDDGVFSSDFKIYGHSSNQNKSKLIFPIRNQRAQTYIPLSVGKERSPKAFYISAGFLISIKNYFEKMEDFCYVMYVTIEDTKNYFAKYFLSLIRNKKQKMAIENYFFNDSCHLTKEEKKIVFDLFNTKKEDIYRSFIGFFEKICKKLSDILLENMYKANDIVRFHFRYLSNRETLTYLSLCSYIYNNNEKAFDISEIEYGQLIEKAYNGRCSLIYSVNKEYATKGLKERWHNFITVVPLFHGNEFKVSKGMSNMKIPYITFGVTTNSEKYDELLYCMDYFDIKKTLENIISLYLQFFCIEIDDFCKWLCSYKEKGEDSNEK